jgi:hypothetical protein
MNAVRPDETVVLRDRVAGSIDLEQYGFFVESAAVAGKPSGDANPTGVIAGVIDAASHPLHPTALEFRM